MRYTFIKLFIVLFLPLLLVPTSSRAQISDTLSIQLTQQSNLEIFGKTNINSFKCELNQDLEVDTLDIPAVRESDIIALNNAVVNVQTKNFDCGQKKITADFKKTLKADEHPVITLDYQQVRMIENTDESDQTTRIICDVSITIAGITKTYPIEFTSVALNGDVLSFQGEQMINIKEFNLNPPNAMFGLIKVNDEVNVDFYLYLKFIDA